MDTIFTLIIVVCGYNCLIGAMILTTYKRSSTVSVSGLVPCGVNASAFHYCAARVTNNTCESLLRDWCVTKDMSDGGVYITKQTITEMLKDTLVSGYDRQIPIYLSEGSELEFKFKLHSGWDAYGIDFKDDSGNIILHTKIRSPDDFFFNSRVNGIWASSEGYENSFSITVGAIYTLKIVCATSGFRIDLDGTYPYTLPYRLPAQTIRSIESYFSGAQGDLYQVTYKTGP